MTETLELDFNLDHTEEAPNWAEEIESPVWEGLHTWLGQAAYEVWE